MSQRFFTQQAKDRVAAAIKAVEQKTSAEVVVCVRRQSGTYRHADYLAGVILLFVVVLLILFLPFTFALEAIPLELLAAFGLGAVGTSLCPFLRRLLTSGKARATAVRTEARAAFHELGVSRTRDRNGLLVFVSLLEKVVEIVPDIGLRQEDVPADKRIALRTALARRDPSAFATALESLGEPLGKAHPRRADDINELSDEVAA